MVQRNFRESAVEYFRQYGLTLPQLMLILDLQQYPGITLNELSEHLGLAKSTVSDIVDRLEKQGIVVRERPKDNRRIIKISISQDFCERENIAEIKKNFTMNLFKNIEPAEAEKIIHGLEKLYSLMNRNEGNR